MFKSVFPRNTMLTHVMIADTVHVISVGHLTDMFAHIVSKIAQTHSRERDVCCHN